MSAAPNLEAKTEKKKKMFLANDVLHQKSCNPKSMIFAISV